MGRCSASIHCWDRAVALLLAWETACEPSQWSGTCGCWYRRKGWQWGRWVEEGRKWTMRRWEVGQCMTRGKQTSCW